MGTCTGLLVWVHVYIKEIHVGIWVLAEKASICFQKYK